MVLVESNCWRSGERRRGGASRSPSGHAGAAASGPGEPTAGTGAVAAGSGPSREVAISAALCSGCCCDLITFSFFLGLSFHYTHRIFSQALATQEADVIRDADRDPGLPEAVEDLLVERREDGGLAGRPVG